MALTGAERYKRHYEKRKAELDGYREKVQAFLDAMQTACEARGHDTLCRNLPDDPHEALEELTRRLDGKSLVCFKLAKGPNEEN